MMDPFVLQQKLWLRKKGSERQIVLSWNKPTGRDLRYLYEGWYDLEYKSVELAYDLFPQEISQDSRYSLSS